MAQGPPRFSLRHTPGLKPLEEGFSGRIDIKEDVYEKSGRSRPERKEMGKALRQEPPFTSTPPASSGKSIISLIQLITCL